MATRGWHALELAAVPPARIVSPAEAAGEQRAVIKCRHVGPCIVLAGPGAGKTYCLVKRLFSAIRDGEVFQPLVLSFTISASSVLMERLARAGIADKVAVRRTQKEVWAAFGEAHRGGSGTVQLRIASKKMSKTMLVDAMRSCRATPPDLEAEVRRVLRCIEDLDEAAVTSQVRADVLAHYAQAKRLAQHVDSSDVRKWALEHPDVIVARWVEQGFTHVYLDEAQDASRGEIAVMTAVHRASLVASCVLDLRQALYGFRGARAEELVTSLEEFETAHRHELIANRRSGAAVVGELNAFSAVAFTGAEARPMVALESKGQGLRAVVCNEEARVLEAASGALAAVQGLERRPGINTAGDRKLADALGLPAELAPEQSVAFLAANGKDARKIFGELRQAGFDPVLLVRSQEDPTIEELLYGLVDPEGHVGGPARIYGGASPICMALNALRRKPTFAMQQDSKGAQSFDSLIARLRSKEMIQLDDGGETRRDFDQMLRITKKELGNLEGATRRGHLIRQHELAAHARVFIEEWQKIRSNRATGEGSEVQQLVDLASSYLLSPRSDGSLHPLVAELREGDLSRRGAAEHLDERLNRRSTSSANQRKSLTPRSGARCFVAVINQVKGDEFDFVVISALGPNRFPFKGEDTMDERYRWWVALSRAIDTVAFLGVEGNDLYLRAETLGPPLTSTSPLTSSHRDSDPHGAHQQGHGNVRPAEGLRCTRQSTAWVSPPVVAQQSGVRWRRCRRLRVVS